MRSGARCQLAPSPRPPIRSRHARHVKQIGRYPGTWATHKMTDLISVVLPVFNERDSLAPLLEEIAATLAHEPHEVVAVDDGSTDGSLDELHRLAARHTNLRAVHRTKRGGQSAALLDGAENAWGDVIITLDADGQNDPKDIPQMLERYRQQPGQAVVGYRFRRVASGWKRVQARVANAVRDLITGDRVRDTGCALRVIRRSDMIRLPRFRGVHRFIPTLLRNAGVRVVEVPVNDRPRLHGRSKYGMWNRVVVGLIDAFGVRWLKLRSLPPDNP